MNKVLAHKQPFIETIFKVDNLISKNSIIKPG